MCVMLGGMPTVQLVPSDRPPAAIARGLLYAGNSAGDQAGRSGHTGGWVQGVVRPGPAWPISLVAAHPNQEACVCDLTEPVGLSQLTVSHHLKLLVEAGILRREQRGKWAYYKLVPDTLDTLAGLIASPSR